jgi:hypothetical protein
VVAAGAVHTIAPPISRLVWGGEGWLVAVAGRRGRRVVVIGRW